MTLNDFAKKLVDLNDHIEGLFFAVDADERDDDDYSAIYTFLRAGELKIPQNCSLDGETIVCFGEGGEVLHRIDVRPIKDVPAKEIKTMRAPLALGGQWAVGAAAQRVYEVDRVNAQNFIDAEKELRQQILDILDEDTKNKKGE